MMINKIIITILVIFVIGLVIFSYIPTSKVNLHKPNINIPKEKSNLLGKLKTLAIGKNIDRNLDIDVCFSPEDNCEVKLVDLINSSKHSIDCAIYDIGLEAVTNSLISSAESGKKVRIVSDEATARKKSSDIGKIRSSDINVILSPESSSIMHDKFCVFDNKIVWVGSMNFTLNGNYKNNNNDLIIKDKKVANLFTQKIDSFFNGDFSKDVVYDANVRKIGNTEIYFCPEDNCKEQVIRHIRDTNKSIDCMFFSYTLDDITFELEDLENINKRFILENRTVDNYSEYDNLKDANIPVILDKNPNSMHNKFCIFDNKVVMTGSMNMSRNGTENNDESLVFVTDESIANKYSDYFNKYWNMWNN